MSGAWKQQERKVAGWWSTFRNPLSGRNNVNDDGTRRLGDIIYKHAVVEVKRRKTTDMRVGKDTRELAKSMSLPWIVYEFKTGEADMVKLTCSHETAALISDYLAGIWSKES